MAESSTKSNQDTVCSWGSENGFNANRTINSVHRGTRQAGQGSGRLAPQNRWRTRGNLRPPQKKDEYMYIKNKIYRDALSADQTVSTKEGGAGLGKKMAADAGIKLFVEVPKI